MVFVIDPKLSKDVSTITLSYTFFEVGGKTPRAGRKCQSRKHRLLMVQVPAKPTSFLRSVKLVAWSFWDSQ